MIVTSILTREKEKKFKESLTHLGLTTINSRTEFCLFFHYDTIHKTPVRIAGVVPVYISKNISKYSELYQRYKKMFDINMKGYVLNREDKIKIRRKEDREIKKVFWVMSRLLLHAHHFDHDQRETILRYVSSMTSTYLRSKDISIKNTYINVIGSDEDENFVIMLFRHMTEE